MVSSEGFEYPAFALCWNCQNAVPEGKKGCSWSKKQIPVRGWTAVPGKTRKGGWRVIDCPEYMDDEERAR